MPRLKTLLLGLIALLATTAVMIAALVWLETPKDREAALARIDRMATRMTEAGHWPAVSLAAVAPGEVIWLKSYGMADIATDRAMTPATPMPIGSISKVLIGMTAASLAAQDAFDLDAPLQAHWPQAPDALSGVTFRHLATHTGGLRDLDAVYEDHAYHQGALRHPTPLADFLNQTLLPDGPLYDADTFAGTEPGTEVVYSNMGAALAAAQLARATGTDFAVLSETHALQPLGLTRATWDATTLPPNTRATLYEDDGTGTFTALAPYALATWPDGGLNATAQDLATLLATAMGGGRLGDTQRIAPEVITLQQAPALPASRGADADGLFWQRGDISFLIWSFSLEGHSGGDPGVITFMYRVRGTDRGFVLMLNGLRDSTWSEIQIARLATALANLPEA